MHPSASLHPYRSRLAALALAPLLLAGSGCATGAPVGALGSVRHARYRPYLAPSPARGVPDEDPAYRPLRVSPDARARIVRTARELVGKPQVRVDGRLYPSDCTGLIRALYEQVGVKLMKEGERGDNGVTAIFRFTQRMGRVYEGGRPLPGDLVFFRETYDQNRDGRHNDGLTHIGVVEEIRADGTVHIIHKVDRGVVRYRMNLDRRRERRDPSTGTILNDALRAPSRGSRERLTAELFEAYGTVLPPGDASVANR